MATRIRLRRVGRKKQPEYRIVVAERTAARDGRAIDTLGYYRPCTKAADVEIDADRARAWLAKGATPSETVWSLFKRAGVFAGPSAAAAPAADTPAQGVADAAAPAPAPEG